MNPRKSAKFRIAAAPVSISMSCHGAPMLTVIKSLKELKAYKSCKRIFNKAFSQAA